MSTRLSCEAARKLAPELALGIISGDERAELIAHTASCLRCRELVESLSVAADRILLIAPEHEPPAGFESGVLARITAPERSRRKWWLIGAAALIASLATAGGLWWATAADRQVASYYRAALREAGGQYFGVEPLRSDATSEKVGNTFAYQGTPSWVFVVVEDMAPMGTYEVELSTTDDKVIDLGTFELSATQRTWGTDISVHLREVRVLRFTGDSGDVLEARFKD